MEHILIIIAFSLAIFFPTLRFTIIIDDITHYLSIQKGWLDNAWKNVSIKRPMSIVHLIVSRFYGGGTLGRAKPGEAPDAEPDHLVTIIMHTLASVLVYIAFKPVSINLTGNDQAAFFAGILYVCNPTNVQTSIWLNGRRYLVNVILVLTMVILTQIKYGVLIAAPLYIATFLFHVTAAFSPVLFGLYAVPLMFFMLLFRKKIAHKIEHRSKRIYTKDWKTYTPKRLIVTVKVYGFHFFKMFVPGIVMINYPMLFWWGVTPEGDKDAYSFTYDFYKGVLALILTATLAIFLPGPMKLYVLYLFLSVLQWCAIIPAAHQMPCDRYVSTAMPFAMLILAYLVSSPMALIAIAGFYTTKLWTCMDMFIDIWHYYKYQLYHAPHITTPRKDVINYLFFTQDFIAAWHYTREGLKYTPNDFAMLTLAATCAKAVGSRQQALEYLLKAEQNYYIDQQEIQEKWIEEFKRTMKKQDAAQLNRKRF